MSSVFDRLPSAQDLLSRPVLRRLTQTLDRQIVVGRVKQYLSEVRTQFEQTASEGKLPSLTGLAERIARWIAEREQLGPRLVINASGDLFHADQVHLPIAEAACAAMVSSALGGVFDNHSQQQALAATETRLARLSAAEAVTTTTSPSAAVALVFATHFADCRVLVRRGDVIELPDGLRLSELAKQRRVELAEVGASNLVRAEDFTQALQTEATAWLRMGTQCQGEGEQPIEIDSVRHQAGDGFFVVEVLSQATVADWTQYGLSMIPVVGDRLAAGVDLVIFPGDRLLGAPGVGIVAGKKTLIDAMNNSVEKIACQLDPIRAAGLDAAVRLYDDTNSTADKHPLLSLLTTPIENLRNRATRIAPQLAALDGVADAQVVEAQAEQSPLPGETISLPTCQIQVFPESMPVAEVRQQLATHPQFSILPVANEEQLLFDLRSVHPRYDAELVARISEVFVDHQSAS